MCMLARVDVPDSRVADRNGRGWKKPGSEWVSRDPLSLFRGWAQVDQAALTGESLPVRKFTGDVAFSGSTVKQGEKECLVYATGLNTFFGRAASLIAGTNSVANLQKVMTKIGAICLITIAVWVLVELATQFGGYHHPCRPGAGEFNCCLPGSA